MEVLIILATIMALFGVIGYTHGTKFSLFYAAVDLAGHGWGRRWRINRVRIVNLLNQVGPTRVIRRPERTGRR